MSQFRTASALFQLLDRDVFDELCRKWQMDKGIRKLSTWDETRTLIMAYLMGLKSLREIEEVFFVPRSTLDDALRKRRSGFFFDLCKATIARIIAIAPCRKVRRALKTLLAVDATSIRVNARLAGEPAWGLEKKNKRAAAKLTLIWDVGGEWVQDFRIGGGFGHDAPVAAQFTLVNGATYVFDRGYCDLKLWWRIVSGGAHFVTRLKDWKSNREERARLIKGAENCYGVLWDGPWIPPKQTLWYHSADDDDIDVPDQPFRRVIFHDEESGKLLDFVTSDWTTPALEIADIYKRRWAIELVFRWFKGHMNLRYLDTRNKNAIKTQIAVAILTRLLLQLEKLKHRFKQSAWVLLRTIEAYIKRNGLVVMGFATAYTPRPRRVQRSGVVLCEI
jgi:hypothetical protein